MHGAAASKRRPTADVPAVVRARAEHACAAAVGTFNVATKSAVRRLRAQVREALAEQRARDARQILPVGGAAEVGHPHQRRHHGDVGQRDVLAQKPTARRCEKSPRPCRRSRVREEVACSFSRAGCGSSGTQRRTLAGASESCRSSAWRDDLEPEPVLICPHCSAHLSAGSHSHAHCCNFGLHSAARRLFRQQPRRRYCSRLGKYATAAPGDTARRAPKPARRPRRCWGGTEPRRGSAISRAETCGSARTTKETRQSERCRRVGWLAVRRER